MSYNQEANKKYLKNRYKKQREYLISLLGDCCVKCGAKEDLQFDHIDPELKSFSVSRLWALKDLPKVEKELEKCQLLCENCHIEKTSKENSGRPETYKHGTLYSWMKKKCNCEECLDSKLRWNEERNKKRRAGSARGAYNLPAEHGTRKRYSRGCRCELCRAINAKAERERRAKIRS